MYRVGNWSDCSGTNTTDAGDGDEGFCPAIQVRNVFCEQIVSKAVVSVVEDKKCDDLNLERPIAQKACDEELTDDDEEDAAPAVSVLDDLANHDAAVMIADYNFDAVGVLG